MSTNMTLDPVLLKILQQVSTSIMVNTLFHGTSKANEIKIWMHKEHFNHFLRINNRRTFGYLSDFILQGYPVHMSEIKVGSFYDCRKWCEQTFGKYRFISNGGYFIFTSEKDANFFNLRWAEQSA